MREEILQAISDKSLIPKVDKELDFLEVEDNLNGRPMLEYVYDLWKKASKRKRVGNKNEINSWTIYALGMTSEKPDGEFIPARRAFARAGWPDVDSDFDYERRQEIYDYLIYRWGRENVGNIGTYQGLKIKSFIRRCGKAMDVADAFHKGPDAYISNNEARVTEIIKSLPPQKGMFMKAVGEEGDTHVIKTVEDANKHCKDFRFYMDQYPDLPRHAKNLEGLLSNFGQHAAGIVISDVPLDSIAPLRETKKVKAGTKEKDYATQYTMEDLEHIGLIKFDILALSTLSVIARCLSNIEKHYGITVDIKSMKPDNDDTFALYRTGKLTGVFQCEEWGMQKTMKEMAVDRFEDIMAGISLFRPGPMASIPQYCARKLGSEDVDYYHDSIEPFVKPYLENTYGLLVYQEQVMQICNALAGFSISDGYVVIKAIGKKKESLLKKYRDQFINGCFGNKIDKSLAADYWDNFIKPFAAYGFNKSHACCYGLISYYTAYLKTHYPEEFMCAYLNVEMKRAKYEKIETLEEECRRMEIEIMPRKLNACGLEYAIHEKKDKNAGSYISKIMPSIQCKGLSHLAAANIVENAPYANFREFVTNTDKCVDAKAVESLVEAGYFGKVKKSKIIKEFGEIRDDLKKAARRGVQSVDLFA